MQHGIRGGRPIPGNDLQGFSCVQTESQVAKQVQELRVDVVPFVCAMVAKNPVDVRQGRGKIGSRLPVDCLQALAGMQVVKRKGALIEIF
jgi:hypothetical protein